MTGKPSAWHLGLINQADNAVSSAVKADDRRMHTISVKAIITTTSSAARLVNACRLPRLSLYLP